MVAESGSKPQTGIQPRSSWSRCLRATTKTTHRYRPGNITVKIQTMDSKERILIVDDETQLTRVLRRSLTTHGYDVRVAGDGEFALQTFHDWPPALVITDLAMPNIDGLELCRRLRATSEVPIIVLSVRGDEKTKVEALNLGADDYVTKPFGMDELLARIRATLRRAPADEGGSQILEAGDFRVDLDSRTVTLREADVHLTPK